MSVQCRKVVPVLICCKQVKPHLSTIIYIYIYIYIQTYIMEAYSFDAKLTTSKVGTRVTAGNCRCVYFNRPWRHLTRSLLTSPIVILATRWRPAQSACTDVTSLWGVWRFRLNDWMIDQSVCKCDSFIVLSERDTVRPAIWPNIWRDDFNFNQVGPTHGNLLKSISSQHEIAKTHVPVLNIYLPSRLS